MKNKIEKLIKKYITVIRYVLIGITGSVFNIALYMLLIQFFKEQYLVCNVACYIMTLVLLYILNKIYVFKDKKRGFRFIIKQFLFFGLSRLLSLCIDTLVLFICVDKLVLNDLISKIIANAGTTVLNYFIGKKLFNRPTS